MSFLADAGVLALAGCALALIAGGLVKGMTGIGLPLVAVPVLATVMPVPQALALMTVPSMATSLMQTFQGGHHAAAFRRVVTLLVGLLVGMLASVPLLATVPVARLLLVLGVIVVVFSAALHRQVVVRVAPRHEWWAGLLTGIAAGLIGGVSLFVGPIFVMYLAGLGLHRDVFVAAVSITNLVAAALFALLIAGHGIAGGEDFALSAAATVIVFAGLAAGQRLRTRIDEAMFRRVLGVVLFAIGLNLIRRALA